MRRFFIVFLLYTFPVLSFGQTCSNLSIVITPDTLATTCENFTLEVYISNTGSPINNVGAGIYFQHQSWVTTTPAPDDTLGGFFVFNVGTVNADTTFNIQVIYGCSSIATGSGITESLTTSVNDSAGVILNGSLCVNSVNSFSYDLASPFFIRGVPDIFVSNGTVSQRTFFLRNNGNDSYFNNYFSFSDSLDTNVSGYLRITGADLMVNDSIIDTVRHAVPGNTLELSWNNFAPVIAEGDSIKVIEYFEAYSCPITGSCHLNYKWGCDSVAPCKDVSFLSSVLRDAITPDVRITRLLPGNTTSNYWDNSCTGDTTHWRYSISNHGRAHNDAVIYLEHSSMDDMPFFTYILNDASHQLSCSPALADSIEYLDSLTQYQSPNPVPQCLIDNPDAIYRARFFIGDFYPGDTIILDFYTLRCCPNDEQIDSTAFNEFDLFNIPKYFNHWLLRVRSPQDCSPQTETISHSEGLSTYGNNISTNHIHHNVYPDLNLKQQYFASISDMSVPHGNNCGASEEFIVNNTGFDLYGLSGYWDQQLFQDTVNSEPSGQIKVRIELEPGLHFDSDTSHVPFMYSPLLNKNWTAVNDSFTQIVSPTGISTATAWEGIFIIDSAHFGNYDTLMDFLNFSQFHYWLYPCCTPEPYEPAKYEVKFFLNPLPQGSCDSCYIPLYKTGDEIRVHCPGCLTPGIETTYFRLERNPNSFGLYDSDNDGLADSTQTQISIADTNAVSLIRRNASMAGDDLTATMRGTFHDGDLNAYHDLTYDAWDSTHSQFTYLYIEEKISFSDSSAFNLVPQSATLTIYPDTCSNCPLVYPVDMNNEFVRDSTYYFFKFQLADFDTASSGTYHINVEDEFELQVNYTVCNNYIFGTGSPEDNFFDADPIGAMYFTDQNLSGVSLLTHAQGIYTAGEGYEQLCDTVSPDTCSYNADALDSNWLFFCGGYGCIHRFYTIRTQNTSDYVNLDASNAGSNNGIYCDKAIRFKARTSIGGFGSANVFPFEFRSAHEWWSMQMPQFKSVIPVGYQVWGTKHGTLFHTYNPGCADFNTHQVQALDTFPVALTGAQDFSISSFDFADENIPLTLTQTCLDYFTVDTAGPFYIGDEYFEELMTVYIYPDCDTQACITTLDPNDFVAILQGYGCGSDTFSSPLPAGIFTMPYVYNDTSCIAGEKITEVSLPGSPVISSQHVAFGIQVQNVTATPLCVGSPNTWIFIPDSSFLSNIQFVSTTTGCPFAGDTISADTNGFFHLGEIDCDQFCNYTMLADYSTCHDTTLQELLVYHGWHCGEFPNTSNTFRYPLSINDACGQYLPDTLRATEATVTFEEQVDTSYSQPVSFILCDSSQFEACVTSLNGGVYGIIATIDLHDSLLILADSSVYLYYNNNADSVLINVDTSAAPLFAIDLSPYDSLLDSLTHELGGGDWICLRYTVVPFCGYQNLNMPEVNFGAITFCGDTIPDSVLVTYPDWIAVGDSCTPPCGDPLVIAFDTLQPICSGRTTLAVYVSGGIAPYTYVWNTLDSTDVIDVNILSDTTLVVTVTDSLNHTITDSITVFVHPYDNCCVPKEFDFNDTTHFNFSDTLASQLPFNQIATSGIIMINDTFTIDVPEFTIRQCQHVILGPNAVIKVLPGDTLNIESSHLYACADDWFGINLDTTAHLFIDSTLIENSIIAVFADSASQFRILYGEFYNNQYGVWAQKGDFTTSYIRGSTFDHDVDSAVFYGNISEMHVFAMEATNIHIGDSGYASNTFRNANYGVVLVKSNGSVDNNLFEHVGLIENSLWVNPNTQNGAVFASGSGDTVTIGTNSPNQFTGNIVCVNLQDGQNANITNNNFAGERGVDKFAIYRESSGAAAVLRVSGNTFTDQMYSSLFKLVDGDSVEIANNSVNMDSIGVPHYYQDVVDSGQYGKSGFYIAGNVPESINGAIHDNEISNVHYKIVGLNLSGVTISDNKIYETIPSNQLSGSTIQTGIMLMNMDSIQVDSNFVIWDKYTPDTSGLQVGWMKGIFLKDVTNSNVEENHLKNLPSGIVFFGHCESTNLRCNAMDTNYVGVWLDPNAINYLTDQGDWQNVDTLSTSWNNHWIGNIGTNVYGLMDSVSIDWTYDTLDVNGDPGVNPNLYTRRKATIDYGCTAPARFGNIFGGDTTEADTVSFIIVQQLDSLANLATIEANMEYVALVNENYFAQGIPPDSAVVQHLTDIALMHPYYGGRAVYYARAMVVKDTSDLLNWSIQRRAIIPKAVESGLQGKLFPNPTTGDVTFTYPVFIDGSKLQLLTFDNLGRKIDSRIMTNNSITFSTALYLSGMYIVQVLEDGKLKESHRMAVIH